MGKAEVRAACGRFAWTDTVKSGNARHGGAPGTVFTKDVIQGEHSMRWTRAAMLATAAAILSVARPAAADPPPAAEPSQAAAASASIPERASAGSRSPDHWRQLIADLDHDSYLVRERASAALAEGGAELIEPLSQAIERGSLETVIRGISLLRRMVWEGDRSTAKAARAALERLAEPQVSTAASHASTALYELAFLEEERAYQSFERLGGRYATGMVFLAGVPTNSVGAVVGKGWHGTDEDLEIFAHMSQLERLSFYGPRVDDQAVPYLTRLTGLKRLELYGTKISDEGIRRIQNALRSTEIEVRRGGLLGVGGTLNNPNCLINTVRPGSAADKAGVQPGDVVVECQGKPVADFKVLTDIIANYPGGDTVRLVVERGGVKVPLQVTLDEWE